MNGVHYVRLFISVMTPFQVVHQGSIKIDMKHELRLISVAPIPGMKNQVPIKMILKIQKL